MSFILIYITNPDIEHAKKIINPLLNKKLIACANIFPVESFYSWKNKIENSKEIVSILKTKTENWEEIKQEVKLIHKYKVPCIIKIPAEANQEFEEWVRKETG